MAAIGALLAAGAPPAAAGALLVDQQLEAADGLGRATRRNDPAAFYGVASLAEGEAAAIEIERLFPSADSFSLLEARAGADLGLSSGASWAGADRSLSGYDDVSEAARRARSAFEPGQIEAVIPRAPVEGPTLRDLLKLYVNVVPASDLPGGATIAASRPTPRPDDARAASPSDDEDGLLGALLSRSADATIGRVLRSIFRPSIGVDGIVSFSIMGFGNFAIVVSERRHSVNVVDIDTGKALEMPFDGAPAGLGLGPGRLPGVGGEADAAPQTGAASKAKEFLKKAINIVYRFVTNPLTISGVLLTVLILGIWQLHSSRA